MSRAPTLPPQQVWFAINVSRAMDKNMEQDEWIKHIHTEALKGIQDGIIINAAGFTHTSVAIRDALQIFDKTKIELHMSNIYSREDFRKKSLISDVVTGGIFGLGSNGYILAIIAMHKMLINENK